jgi:hypothetical protein
MGRDRTIIGAVCALSLARCDLPGADYASAEARFTQAQNELVQAQNRQIARKQEDLARAAAIMSDPVAMADPVRLQQLIALLIVYPDQARVLPELIAASMALGAKAGGLGTQAQADSFAAATGVAPYGNTATGQAAVLASHIAVAKIAAGPGYAAAAADRYAAGRALEGEKYRADNLLVAVVGADGQPHWMTAAEATRTGAVPYNSAAAVARLKAEHTPVPVSGAAGASE